MDKLPIGVTRCVISEMVEQEKRFARLQSAYHNETVDKSTIWMVVIITILSALAGYAFSMAYQTQGWENYYWAGFLTVGILVPILILSTVKIADWLNARKTATGNHGS